MADTTEPQASSLQRQMPAAEVMGEDVAKRAPAANLSEIGVTGLKVWSGYVNEEFLRELQGIRGVAVFREMSENDSTIGAILWAFDRLLRAVEWNVEAANNTAEAKREAEFALSLLDDMSHPIEDVISEILSMLTYGWAYMEHVFKRRVGPREADPTRRSKYDDGRIGVRKLAIRSQDSLHRWEMQEDGGIRGMWQQPPVGGGVRFIPIERSLLFRTMARKNNPEGVSILRNAYRDWYFLKTIEEIEAIGIERELAGLPVVRIPAKYLAPDASTAERAVADAYKQIARDVKFNRQGGLVIPSDPFFGKEGQPTEIRQVEVELLSSGGERSIDTDKVVLRKQRGIARSVLADFIMLGSDSVGSYALSEDKSGLFLQACEAIMGQIEYPLNAFLLPRVWDVNGLDRELMPKFKAGRIAPADLDRLGNYVRNMVVSGVIFPDPEMEEHARKVGGLPPPMSVGSATEGGRRRGDLNDDPFATPRDRNAERRAAMADAGGEPDGDKDE